MLGVDGVDAAGADRDVVDVASLDPHFDGMQHVPLGWQSGQARRDGFLAITPEPPGSLIGVNAVQPGEPGANGFGVAGRSLLFRDALAGTIQRKVTLQERSPEQAGLNQGRNHGLFGSRNPRRDQPRNRRREISSVALIFEWATLATQSTQPTWRPSLVLK
jgi:hypothetical protein